MASKNDIEDKDSERDPGKTSTSLTAVPFVTLSDVGDTQDHEESRCVVASEGEGEDRLPPTGGALVAENKPETAVTRINSASSPKMLSCKTSTATQDAQQQSGSDKRAVVVSGRVSRKKKKTLSNEKSTNEVSRGSNEQLLESASLVLQNTPGAAMVVGVIQGDNTGNTHTHDSEPSEGVHYDHHASNRNDAFPTLMINAELVNRHNVPVISGDHGYQQNDVEATIQQEVERRLMMQQKQVVVAEPVDAPIASVGTTMGTDQTGMKQKKYCYALLLVLVVLVAGVVVGVVVSKTPATKDICTDAQTIPAGTETISGDISNEARPLALYAMVGTGDAYSVSTCSSVTNFVAALDVFSGSCDERENITSAAKNENCQGAVDSIKSSRAIFRTEPGMEYFIAVYGANYVTVGDFELQISTIKLPSNDACSGAVLILPGDGPIFGTTVNATHSANCTGSSSCYHSPDLWYRVEGTGSNLTASTCDERTDYDSQLAIFEGAREECDSTSVGWNDDSCGGVASKVQWLSKVGVTYYIRVYGHTNEVSNEVGSFVLRVT